MTPDSAAATLTMIGDYWRIGLPLEVLILLVSIPMILLVWPL
jgi:di/tricarboxylate transporter